MSGSLATPTIGAYSLYGLIESRRAGFVLRYFDPFIYDHLVQFDANGKFDIKKPEKHIYGKHRLDRRIWIDTCNAAVAWVAQQPEVLSHGHDEQEPRIALVGYSLGGFVALASADECMNDAGLPEVNAVVVNFGARFKDSPLSSKLPPVYFFHGELDEIIDVAHARKTSQELCASGVRTFLTTYPDQGHVITGWAAEDCRTRTYAFLATHLMAQTKGLGTKACSSRAAASPRTSWRRSLGRNNCTDLSIISEWRE